MWVEWISFWLCSLTTFPKQGLHWWGSHGIVLVPWISPTLWSGAAVEGATAISGPSTAQAQARFLEIWGPGNPEFWNPKIQKIKVIKIKIRDAQNVGKVWISRKKSSWPHLGPSGPIFCVSGENAKNTFLLPIFLGGPMAAIHPVWTTIKNSKNGT